MRVSKKRMEMGEEKWEIYQVERKREKYKKWLNSNKEKIKEYNKKKSNYSVFWRARAKKELIDYKGGKCLMCGYNKNIPRAYDFHHRNPKDKEFTISKYSILNMEKLKKEVDKCDLLCRNCHAELHDEEYSEIRRIMGEKHDNFIDSRFLKKIRICKICKKEFETSYYKQYCCSDECRVINNRKVVNRPSLEELKKMMDEMPMTKIGEKYGVSSNAVKKWAKIYKIIE
jgi:hypothetical protein